MIEYGIEDWDKDLAHDFIDFEKRNNMDIYMTWRLRIILNMLLPRFIVS